MRSLLLAALAAASCALTPLPCAATVTADFTFTVNDGQLDCAARLHGIAPGEHFKLMWTWSAPGGGELEYGDGRKVSTTEACFLSTTWSQPKEAGDGESKALCFCADTHEKGCSRTHATRTIEYTMATKKSGDVQVRGVGAWTAQLIRLDTGEILGTKTYMVE